MLLLNTGCVNSNYFLKFSSEDLLSRPKDVDIEFFYLNGIVESCKAGFDDGMCNILDLL